MTISYGSVTFGNSSLKLDGVLSPPEGIVDYQFLGGGYRPLFGDVGGQQISLTAVLDSTDGGDRLVGWYTWADILALRAAPNSPQQFVHPLLTELGLTGVTAVLDKSSLNGLTQYVKGRGAYINPSITTTYYGTDVLLKWYGVLNFRRMS